MFHTCNLDASERGKHTMSEIGKELGTSRHQVRIDLDSAMRKLGATEEGRELLDALDE